MSTVMLTVTNSVQHKRSNVGIPSLVVQRESNMAILSQEAFMLFIARIKASSLLR